MAEDGACARDAQTTLAGDFFAVFGGLDDDDDDIDEAEEEGY